MELWEGRNLNGRETLRISKTAKRTDLFGNGILVSEQVVESDALTSWHAIVLETVVDKRRGDEVSKNLPLVNDDDLELLDEVGLVRVGARVKTGSILVAKARRKAESELSTEGRLIRSIFGMGSEEHKDVSLRWPYRDEGLVLKVSPGDQLSERNTVRVVVGVGRKLTVGDVLEDERGGRYVVTGFNQRPNVEVLTSKKSPLATRNCVQFKKLTLHSEEKWQSRSNSVTSSLTRMPLGVGPNPGQKVKGAEVALLHANGLSANLKELLTIKSGARDSLLEAFEAIYADEPVVVQGTPEIAHLVCALLRGLGISPSFIGEMGEEVVLGSGRAIEGLRLRLAKPDEIRSWSFGPVRKPEFINYRTMSYEPEGLYCEKIFGPTCDFKCYCGKYHKKWQEGIVCERCGVEVTRSSARRRRMGHIELPYPVVHLWLIAPIAKLLEMEEQEVKKLVYFQAIVVTSPSVRAGEIIAGNVSTTGMEILSGGEAIKWLLERKGVDSKGWLLEAIPVIPPDLRPVVQLEDGSWGVPDVLDLYRRLINRTDRLRKTVELKAPRSIISQHYLMVQEAVDALFDNMLRAVPVTGTNNRPMVSLSDSLEQRCGQLFDRRVEFSGRGVVVPDPNLEVGAIGLPREFLLELFRPHLTEKMAERCLSPMNIRRIRKVIKAGGEAAVAALGCVLEGQLLLVSHRTQEPAMMFLSPVENDIEAVSLHPETAQKLGIVFEGETVTVHLPLSKEARSEAVSWIANHGITTLNPGEGLHPVLSLLAGQKELVDWATEGSIKALTELDKLAIGS